MLAPTLRQIQIAAHKCIVDYAGLTMPVVNLRARDVPDAQSFVGTQGASHCPTVVSGRLISCSSQRRQ